MRVSGVGVVAAVVIKVAPYQMLSREGLWQRWRRRQSPPAVIVVGCVLLKIQRFLGYLNLSYVSFIMN